MDAIERIQDLRRKASDAATAVDVLYSPYETMLRATLNPGARRAAEVGVCNAVSGLEVARRALAAAEVSHHLTVWKLAKGQPEGASSKTSFKLPSAPCDSCGKTGMVCFSPKLFRKMCFRCGTGQ